MKSETNGLILKIAPLLPYASALSTCLCRNVSRSTNRNTGRRKRMLSTVGNGAWLRKRRLDPCFYSGERDGGIILYFLSSTLAVLPALPVCHSLFAQPADLHRFGIKSPLVSRPKTYREAISWDLDGIIHKRCLGLRVALCQSPVLVSEQKGSLCVLYSMYWVGGSVCNNCGPL